MAKSYSIYETKARLSEILRLVKSGREIVINERGRPIAKILPFLIEENLESRLESLQKTGQILSAQGERRFEARSTKKGALKRFLESRD